MNLKYIADKAGVSASTVSNVLNGKGRVSKSVADKIRNLVNAENFVVKHRKRRSMSAAKRYIALGVTEELFFLKSGAFHSQLLKGIKAVLDRHGYSLLLPSTITIDNIRNETQDADGLLLIGFDDDPESFVAKAQIPVVWLFRTKCDLADIVLDDSREVGRLAAKYLFNKGHRIVGYIDERHVENMVEKGLFFSHFMNGLGGTTITVTGDGLFDSGDEESGICDFKLRALLDKLLGGRKRPTALFINGNRLFAAVSSILCKMNIHPVNDIEIFPCINGASDTGEVSRRAFIDINLEDIGKRAAECLLWRLKNKNDLPIRISVRPSLIGD